MRRFGCVGVFLGALTMAGGMVTGQGGVIHNDAVWKDTGGNEIWCNGGNMIQEGDVFYWVGYDTAPRHPWRTTLYSSKNLSDWKFEGTIYQKEGAFEKFGWAGRPAMLHNRATGKYVVLFEASCPEWVRHKVGFAVADKITGPYTLASAEYPEAGRSTGDQSVFQEGDKAYLVTTLDKEVGGRNYLNQALAIYELAPDYLSVAKKVYEGFDNVNGDTTRVPRNQSSREASHIIHVGELYFWFSSGLEGWNSTATKYATAKSLAGPWSELRVMPTEPDSPDSYNTQHDFIVPILGSETQTFVYVGDRYSQHTRRGVGRSIFLPVVWKDGVPSLKWMKNWRLDVATGRYAEVPEAATGPASAPGK